MEIRTENDIELLNVKLKNELGIDVMKYKDEEVMKNFADLFAFPFYAVNSIKWPLIIAFVLYVVGFVFFDLSILGFIIYGILGFILYMASGLFLGLLILVWRLKKDLIGIVDYSVKIMDYGVADLNRLEHTVKPEDRKEVLGLLFKGVICMITLPIVSKIISSNIPIGGKPILMMVLNALVGVSGSANFQENLSKDAGNQDEGFVSYSVNLSSSSGFSNVISNAARFVQVPLKIGFGIAIFCLLLLLYVFW